MLWTPRSLMDINREFVELASREGANRRELCKRFGISPKAGYALLARFAQEGTAAFVTQGGHRGRCQMERRGPLRRLQTQGIERLPQPAHSFPGGPRARRPLRLFVCHHRFMQVDLNVLKAAS